MPTIATCEACGQPYVVIDPDEILCPVCDRLVERLVDQIAAELRDDLDN
jgi:uncharacterized Zn finger protein (UPF0148 family)